MGLCMSWVSFYERRRNNRQSRTVYDIIGVLLGDIYPRDRKPVCGWGTVQRVDLNVFGGITYVLIILIGVDYF